VTVPNRASSLAAAACLAAALACRGATPGVTAPPDAPWERESPPSPLPTPPLGLEAVDLSRAQVQLTPEKVRLGRWLFYDGRLSRDGTISCASCHRPENAFSEPLPHSIGVGGQEGTRKAPPIVNVALFPTRHLFWDGRASSLAEQAQGPIANPVEMGNTLEEVVRTVGAISGYRRAFREVYGDDRLDIQRIADAIAAYEATRLSGGSAYDRFNAGDAAALSPEAQQGLDVFFGRGRCNACHLGPTFTDGKFHNVGIGFEPRQPDLVRTGFVDQGRYAVTHDPRDIGAFKTPTLRDVARRAPYMHDGSSPDLADSVMRYVEIQANPWLDPAMEEVRIFPFDVRPLVAFLRALDGTGFEDVPPTSFPR
jgi:cytochrome c peroxidase